MALGKTRVTKTGYTAAYTVPSGKRAVISTTAFAHKGSEIALVPAELGMNPAMTENSQTANFTSTAISNTFAGNVGAIQFGYAVAIEGNVAVVGSGINQAQSAGYVQIFLLKGSTWVLQQTIIDPENSNTNKFGSAVAISGDNIIVGASAGGGVNGKAYRYTRSGTAWVLADTYEAAVLSFGQAVAIAGDYIVIGSSNAARGYRVSTGKTLQVTFTVSGSTAFGASVACWNDGRVLIGDPAFNTSQGRVSYYFAFANNSPTEILGPAGQTGRFGVTVVTDKTGIFFAVGAEAINTSTGSVYTYRTTAPSTIVQTIANPANQQNSNFGTGLAMDASGNLLVGSYQYDSVTPAVSNQGRAYLYTRNNTTWTLARTIENPSPNANDLYGFGVGLASQPSGAVATYKYKGFVLQSTPTTAATFSIVVGAHNDSIQAGAVYLTGESVFSNAQVTNFEAGVDAIFSFVEQNSIDQQAIAEQQTFERTGLVLDAGESVLIALLSEEGDISLQVRGYEEDV